MNIVFACDNHYAQYLPAVVMGILTHNGHHTIDFYVLDMGIEEQHKQTLSQLVQYYHDKSIQFIPVAVEDFQHFPITISYISLATYLRLKIADYLPHLDKVLYLDVDILVDGDLAPAWNKPLSEQTALSACRDYYIEYEAKQAMLPFKADLGLSNDYFNAGVLLINLAYWREHQVFQKAGQTLQQYQGVMRFQDQDILNILFKDNYERLGDEFNMTGPSNSYYMSRFGESSPPPPQGRKPLSIILLGA